MGMISDYYDLETSKLKLDGQRVALFTDHPGTLGAYREARLREYIRGHAATQYGIANGFISDRDDCTANISDRSSRQIDCLIYDQSKLPNLIDTESFVCTGPECAAAFIEVKSTLGINRQFANNKNNSKIKFPFIHRGRRFRWAGTLIDALENVASAIKIMELAGVDRDTYFAGIIAYEGNKLLMLDVALQSGQIQQQLELTDVKQLPDCVCVLARGWWSFEAYSWQPKLDYTNGIPFYDPAEYDPEKSFINKITGSNIEGAPLQLFTAYMSGRLEMRAVGEGKRIGGLRSGMGRDYEPQNIRIPLACPGKGMTLDITALERLRFDDT